MWEQFLQDNGYLPDTNDTERVEKALHNYVHFLCEGGDLPEGFEV